MRRFRFAVTGRVQGVAFRAYCQQQAERLGVGGFVRNRSDGAVVGEAQADAAVLAAFESWLAAGSPWARVDHVEIEELAPGDVGATFEVRR